MTDGVENLILVHLGIIRAEITALREDVRKVKRRLSGLEFGQASLKRDNAGLYEDSALSPGRTNGPRRAPTRFERFAARISPN